MRLAPWNRFKPSSKIYLLTVRRHHFFCGSFVIFVSCVSHAFASVYCCLVVTCWVRAHLLALVGDVYCIFVTFPRGFLGQVLYLIVSTELQIRNIITTLPSWAIFKRYLLLKNWSKFKIISLNCSLWCLLPKLHKWLCSTEQKGCQSSR